MIMTGPPLERCGNCHIIVPRGVPHARGGLAEESRAGRAPRLRARRHRAVWSSPSGVGMAYQVLEFCFRDEHVVSVILFGDLFQDLFAYPVEQADGVDSDLVANVESFH